MLNDGQVTCDAFSYLMKIDSSLEKPTKTVLR